LSNVVTDLGRVRETSDEVSTMFQIIRDPNDYYMAAGLDDIAHALGDAQPGRFLVEEVSPSGELLPSGHSCRRWGTAVRHPDEQVTLDPDPRHA
jgi:hypothetical protein